jgi:integrase
LFTGLRNSEARSLQWSNVNLECGTIFIGDPKNGEDFTLPMSSFVRKLFTIRKQRSNSRWVFPGKLKDSHISPGYGSCREVIEQCGVEFSPHDLRRTFITIGDEIDVKAEVVKALVNHKSDDVTEGYTVRSIERLRRSSERITQAIIQYAGMPASPFD